MAIDTGGAIIGRRIDLFLGTGSDAMTEAGDVVESVRIRILRPAR
jgi:membrane-bound lytic murein transglycosylase